MVTRKTCSGAGTSTGAPARAGLQKGPAVCQGWSNLEKSSLLKNADEATAEALSEGASRCREDGLRVFRWCVEKGEPEVGKEFLPAAITWQCLPSSSMTTMNSAPAGKREMFTGSNSNTTEQRRVELELRE